MTKQNAQAMMPALQGAGIGLREPHVEYILSHRPPVSWFEVLIDNYMDGPSEKLEQLASCYPLAFHSVGLSLGSTDPLDRSYLRRLKCIVDRFDPDIVSEHLCWTSVHGIHLHDLMPLPYTEEVAHHVAKRIVEVQDFIGRRLLIENVSSYLNFKNSTLQEWEFINLVAQISDCDILLDVNNIVVSAHNNGFNPLEYLQGVDEQRVKQLHIAGYEQREGFLLDSHACPPSDEVWQFFGQVVQSVGDVPTLVEWDDDIPEFDVLWALARRAETYFSDDSRRTTATI